MKYQVQTKNRKKDSKEDWLLLNWRDAYSLSTAMEKMFHSAEANPHLLHRVVIVKEIEVAVMNELEDCYEAAK